MHPLPLLHALLLVTLANGAPVLAKYLLGARWAMPLDGGVLLGDGRPVFGASKTVRGLVAAVVVTALGGALFGPGLLVGGQVAAAAMAGDLLSSFTKRRLGRTPSSRALGIDQVPEALFGLLACAGALRLSAVDVALGVGLFFVGELALSRLLFRVHLRDEPY
ncbi:MAG: hypothetical protein BGP12_10570 [Rhodospirillales bacterium 70-18]|nr:CDP-archaeol synthase [Rhodospirillales bacterium]OJY63471.1 MAG: hypothetical protein BGP12_10570 [Rhodospirillales bacterium 70-18]